MKAYRFRIYPSKAQERELKRHLWLAKNLWNELLAHAKQMYANYGLFPTSASLQLMVKNYGFFSQAQQEIAHRVDRAIIRYLRLRKQNKRAGFPRFKAFDRMKSLAYTQRGFSLEEKLRVYPFGEMNIVKHRKIEGRIKTLSLKRESSGKWFAIFCVEQPEKKAERHPGGQVGIDLGLHTFATLSNGMAVDNPRHLKKYEEKLALMQKRLSIKRRAGKNRQKAKFAVARVYEKVKNTRRDFLHKVTTKLVNAYSMIAIENLACEDMIEQQFGKQINDAGWNTFAGMLCYKAENASSRVVFVDPENTTKECSMCGKMQGMPLSERIYTCTSCGMAKNRDLNAAQNILARATAGHAGSNACGEGLDGKPLEEARSRECESWCATTSLSHKKREPA